GRPDREWKPTVDEYHRRDRYVSERLGQEIALARFERSGIYHISDQAVRNIKDRYRPVEVELAGTEPVLEAGEIDDVVNGLAPGIVHLELQSAAVALGERGSQPVVDRASNGLIGGMLKLTSNSDILGVEGTTSGIDATRSHRGGGAS